MTDPVHQIKERLNIVDVVGQYVKLTKAGKNYTGLSPFKKEKTPSFNVSPDKGMYYDFSSGQGGDMFTFVQEMEGLDFRGALKLLADRAGVEIHHESKDMRDARERIYTSLEESTCFFETKLSENAAAMKYLRERGLEESTIRSFRLGFAPDGWTTLSEHLEPKGYKTPDLLSAGLIKKGESGKHYDRFRSRIMFPIMDSAGRVVAFSGRIFGEPAKDEKNAKYLNSPETSLFDKGRILYGYDKAKAFIRKYDFAIFVEGQMDIVLSHQAGYTNTVAVSGTGLTPEHLSLIDRLTKRLVFAFDADDAGVASTGRASVLALKRGMDVKVVQVPLGKDPADCIKEDADAWKKAVRDAKHVVEFFLARVETTEDLRKEALEMRDTVLPYISRITSGVDQAHFVHVVADRFGLAEDAVWQDVRTIAANSRREEAASPGASVRPTVTQNTPTKPRAPSRREQLEKTLAGFLFWQESLEPRILKEETLLKFTKELETPLEGILARFSEQRDALAFQAECMHDDTQDPHTQLRTLLVDLTRERMTDERLRLTAELRAAEREGEEKVIKSTLEKFHRLATKLEALE